MNNIQEKKEYSEEDVIAGLSAMGKSIAPSKASLQKVLDKVTIESTPSPYAPKKSPYFSFGKIALTMLAIVLLLAGGSLFTYRKPEAVENPGATAGTTNPVAAAPGSQIAMTQSLATPAPQSDTSDISNNDSDASLEQDEANIDSQMAALDTDNSSADQSLQQGT